MPYFVLAISRRKCYSQVWLQHKTSCTRRIQQRFSWTQHNGLGEQWTSGWITYRWRWIQSCLW